MASSASLSSSTLIKSTTLKSPHPHSPSTFLALHTLFKSNNPIRISLLESNLKPLRTAAAFREEFDMSIFERDLGDGGGDGGDSPPSILPGPEIKEEPECPPGLRQYETMVILRPNMSEDERLDFIHKYEELLVGGGAMHVEVLNKGVCPLAYSIKKKNRAGETNTYLDSIQLLFTYFTKPESISIVGETLLRDDDVIRSSSFKIRKRKY
ncbi:Translation elongation factor EF1B/ribosomal protein S6 family protein [Perilla frutescens var. hirtella]|uniref:Translation elongation factor EF1B/ribosomal protein S6 family protein n=1 Tax=Perilla frutescens var. hirtella TaxID=608512 RepID=A0AAD4JLG8_PERFH|nr:Translation elongation factor EF1B/ribosomal protein S6 family protein [Perilla frutescens var. hirtella]